MPKKVVIGIQEFDELIKENAFYVDKTNFIREWWENGDHVTLINRPRRFGKTLNMSMLNCFFSNKYENRGDLFEGLHIWEQKEYRELQGTYPVIFLSFADIKECTYENTYKKFCRIISASYKEHRYLLDGDLLDEDEKEQFHSVKMMMDEVTATTALHDLSCYLSRYYGKKVIILLDEYDTPMQEAYINGYWDELISFIRSLFNSTFKTNSYLKRAVLTGITRVSKESIFSGFNNPEIVSTTSEKYETCFGFTREEVEAALKEQDLIEYFPDVKKWYDGFVFGTKSDIYNPWSIINFLNKKKLDTYWANTSSNSLINRLIQTGKKNVKIVMECLLQNQTYSTYIDEQIIFNQLDYDENAIWSLLVASGYLKILSVKYGSDKDCEEYELALTNLEVKKMFEKLITGWFHNTETNYNEFLEALLTDDLDGMNEFMNDIAMATFSMFDTGKRPSKKLEPERFYHGFVLGLMVDLKDKYEIRSNRESGRGRYDVMLIPKKTEDAAIIIEFKVHNPKKEASLEETVTTALNQIEEKKYETELLERGFAREQIKKYGFAFSGNEVLIGE